jgi:hypothetical protein
VADRFPSLRAVVQVGHSAGGQLVSRYAVGTTVHDQLRERGIYMRSIIANPSSFLYLDRQRPNLAAESGFIDYDEGVPLVAAEPCATFNNYLYGMDRLVPYMGRRPIADMLAAFRTRDIWIFNGMEDNQVRPDMDTSCPASLQAATDSSVVAAITSIWATSSARTYTTPSSSSWYQASGTTAGVFIPRTRARRSSSSTPIARRRR